jgi:hypothetical protein
MNCVGFPLEKSSGHTQRATTYKFKRGDYHEPKERALVMTTKGRVADPPLQELLITYMFIIPVYSLVIINNGFISKDS